MRGARQSGLLLLISRISARSSIDISDILLSVHVSTLVIHCTGDTLINVEHGRFLADHIPNRKTARAAGRRSISFSSTRRSLTQSRNFLPDSISTREGDRVLSTVLFTDIAGSTARCGAIGRPTLAPICSKHITRPSGEELAAIPGQRSGDHSGTGFSPRSTVRRVPCVVPAPLSSGFVLWHSSSHRPPYRRESRSPARTCRASPFT